MICTMVRTKVAQRLHKGRHTQSAHKVPYYVGGTFVHEALCSEPLCKLWARAAA